MLVADVLVSLCAGYFVVRAVYRWHATIRVLGGRRTRAGVAVMWRIRTQHPFRLGTRHDLSPWPIHPSVPVLFECQAIVVVLLMTFWVRDFNAVRDLLQDPLVIPAAIWAVARASEGVLPPCLLYLGVSEPGQFETFVYLAGSRAWLAVSALDQENPAVNRGGSALAPLALAGSLVSERLRRFGLIRLLSIAIPRRRLESIRTTDDVWESSVRAIIGFVPLIVADLRSPSSIVSNELVWVLHAGVSERLVLLTRPDGTTALTLLMRRLAIDLRSIAHLATADELRAVVASRLDDGRELPDTSTPVHGLAEYADRLASAIETESELRTHLVHELLTLKGPSRTLDQAIQSWADASPSTDSPPRYTSSLSAAVGLARRRLHMSSISLHIGADHTAWVDLAVQAIATSFRVSVSSPDRPLDSAAKALVVATLNAESGTAWASPMERRLHVRPLPGGPDQFALANWDGLRQSVSFLADAQTHDGWRDPVGQRTLATLFGIPHDTLLRDDEETMIDELQRVIDAVQGKRAYVPRGGPYSMTIHIARDGSGRAEVASRSRGRWLITYSYAPGAEVWHRPGVALMIAALRAEYQIFNGVIVGR